jgi:hypothetical protein
MPATADCSKLQFCHEWAFHHCASYLTMVILVESNRVVVVVVEVQVGMSFNTP